MNKIKYAVCKTRDFQKTRNCWQEITVGKKYEVLNLNSDTERVQIENDVGAIMYYPEKNFRFIEVCMPKEYEHVYCTECVLAESLFNCIKHNLLLPKSCADCNPLDPEDSRPFKERPNYRRA